MPWGQEPLCIHDAGLHIGPGAQVRIAELGGVAHDLGSAAEHILVEGDVLLVVPGHQLVPDGHAGNAEGRIALEGAGLLDADHGSGGIVDHGHEAEICHLMGLEMHVTAVFGGGVGDSLGVGSL